MTNSVTEIGYVYAAYVAAAVIVTAVTLATLLDARRQRRQLAEIEARGIKRRSAAAKS
jgi:heme exporter protein D